MGDLNMKHFTELRGRINQRLDALGVATAREQIEGYPWLYGALGEVPSRVMFVCENPSLTPTRTARGVDGGPPDIESQWWGSPDNNAAKRFRRVLSDVGLKQSAPDVRGGWRCYITNVVKEANIAGDQEALSQSARLEQTRAWAPILRWQIEVVAPRYVFTVGSRADASYRWLFAHGLVPLPAAARIIHYSARKSDWAVVERMRNEILAVLG